MAIHVQVVDPRPLVQEALTCLLQGNSEFHVAHPVGAVADLFDNQVLANQVPEGDVRVVVAGALALDQLGEQALIAGLRSGHSARLLVLVDSYDERTVCRLLMLGCSGYLPRDAPAETLTKAILAVARGEIWAERHLVTRTLQQALATGGADETLTGREREILGLLRLGHTNRQIAGQLFISPETVKWHIRKLFSKIGVRDRLEAALYAREHNIFPRQERPERTEKPLLVPAVAP